MSSILDLVDFTISRIGFESVSSFVGLGKTRCRICVPCFYDFMFTCFKITGFTQQQSSGISPAKRTDYQLFVEVDEWRRHETALLDFFRVQDDADFRKYPESRHQVLNEWNCARMWVTSHFGKSWKRFEDFRADYAGKPPESDPTESGDGWRMWVLSEKESDVFTEQNAAWELYSACGTGKVSLSDARQIVRDKFPDKYFLWDKVLREFSKLGGRHTTKYLSRWGQPG